MGGRFPLQVVSLQAGAGEALTGEIQAAGGGSSSFFFKISFTSCGGRIGREIRNGFRRQSIDCLTEGSQDARSGCNDDSSGRHMVRVYARP